MDRGCDECQLVTIGLSTVMVPTGRETGTGSASPPAAIWSRDGGRQSVRPPKVDSIEIL
ncbi:hypothetical protein [Streptomyces sp. NPDC091259]|uniref:hypothetical protein n=1 Tax=Streptomyces sp. NPDC091259 TaxID=3365976 RepID=UPI0037F20632